MVFWRDQDGELRETASHIAPELRIQEEEVLRDLGPTQSHWVILSHWVRLA